MIREKQSVRALRAKPAIRFYCPRCAANPGQPCMSERIASANTLGDGWGGYVPTLRPHAERYERRRAAIAAAEQYHTGGI